MTTWRPMTDIEKRAAKAISPGKVRYPVASPPKAIARSLSEQAEAAEPQITDKQAESMWRIVARFRRQIPDAELFAHAAKEMNLSLLRDTKDTP